MKKLVFFKNKFFLGKFYLKYQIIKKKLIFLKDKIVWQVFKNIMTFLPIR